MTTEEFIAQFPFWIQLATMVIGIASGLAALTPTPKDDGVLLVVKKILAILSLNIMGSRALSDTVPKSEKPNEIV